LPERSNAFNTEPHIASFFFVPVEDESVGSSPYDESIGRFIRTSGRFIRTSGLFFLIFGAMAVLFRVTQFIVLGDPPLEELVVAPGFLALQGIPTLVAAVGSIVLALVLTPFAATPFLRLLFNVLLGAGPLAVGYVLWRGQHE
jgi:hypothetical protein